MLTYEPEMKKESADTECCLNSSDWRRRIHLMVSPAMVKAATVGEDVTFVVKGKVFSTEMRESERQDEVESFNEVGIEVEKVEMDAMNEFEKLAED